MTACLEIKNLNKSYQQKQVLCQLSLKLNSGEIMGLIGENGSGKTTIFKTILGLVKKDSGTITVNQQIVEQKNRDYLNDIGSIIEYPTFYEQLTALQNLSLFARLYRKAAVGPEDLDSILKQVGLFEAAHQRVAGFSLGMKQRLGLAQALIHQPSILLLDEPFNGLDPKGMKEFRQLLLQLAASGVAIIVSSHSLEELKKLVDTVTIIHQGTVVFQGKKSDYLALGKTKNTWLLATDDAETTKTILQELRIDFTIKKEEFELRLPDETADEIRRQLMNTLLERQISILKIVEREDNFEDIFLHLAEDEEDSYEVSHTK